VPSAYKIGTDLSLANLGKLFCKHKEKQRSKNTTLGDKMFNFSPSWCAT